MHKRIHTPHNAHIGARLKSAREALREHLEAEESVRLHDAHVETRRAAFLLLSDTTNSVQHARDFTSHIKKTKFAQAHPYKWIIEGIDAALNEYHDLCSARESRTESETVEREHAQALIKNLRGTFEEIAKNRFAAAALISAFCTPDAPTELDGMIYNLGRAIETLEAPRTVSRRPKTPELDRLISQVADLVVSARAQTIRDGAAEGADAHAKELAIMRQVESVRRNDKITRAYVGELLEVGNVVKADSTIKNNLADSAHMHHHEIAAEQRVEISQLPDPIIAPDS